MKNINLRSIGMDKLAIMVACGLIIVICTFNEKGNSKNKNTETSIVSNEYTTDEYEKRLENKLNDILEKMEGVGDVEVMVTLKNTKEKVVLMEEPYSENELKESDSEGGSRESKEKSVDSKTVYITSDDGENVPYVINEYMPKAEGVAVVAQGGDSALVKEKIISVVKSLFDIEANKISVSKME